MDNEKNTNLPDDNAWLDELLGAVEEKAEFGMDEDAMAAHDMSSISDLELEQIMREALSETFQEDLPEETEIPIPTLDDEYRDSYTDGSDSLFPIDETDAQIGPLFEEDKQPEENEEDEEDEEDESVDPDRPVRKVRPKPKKGYGLFGLPHIVSTAVWLVLAIVIGISLGRLLWVCAADVLAFGKPNQEIAITITEDDTDGYGNR